MTLSIVEAKYATPEEWKRIWEKCDYSTFFHSQDWAEIWTAYTNGNIQPAAKLVIFSDGKKALLPLSQKKSFYGLVKRDMSSPGTTYGGWLSIDNLSVEHATLLVDLLSTKFHNIVWRLNPYDKLLKTVKVQGSKEDSTEVLNLKDGFDAIFRRWTKGHRSAVHKAQREGVSVRLATSLTEWRTYYTLYKNSLNRWGDKVSSRYDWEMFNAMHKRRSSHIKLWLAFLNDNIAIAGALTFYAKEHVVYWHGAALAKYFHLRPVNLLIYEIIKDTCDKHYRWFDFNPSGGHKGTAAFKRSFGTESLSCPMIYSEIPWIKAVKRLAKVIGKRQLHNILW